MVKSTRLSTLSGTSRLGDPRIEHSEFNLPILMEDSNSGDLLRSLGVGRKGDIKRGSPAANFRTGGPPPAIFEDTRESLRSIKSKSGSRSGKGVFRAHNTRDMRLSYANTPLNTFSSDGIAERIASPDEEERPRLSLSPVHHKSQIPIQITFRDSQLSDLAQAFKILSRGRDNKIETRELQMLMRACNYTPTKQYMRCLTDIFDPKQTGYIAYKDFVNAFKLKVRSRSSPDELSRGFQFFDKDRQGRITAANLRSVAEELGERLEEEEIQEMINEVSASDGVVTFQQFAKFMNKPDNYEFE